MARYTKQVRHSGFLWEGNPKLEKLAEKAKAELMAQLESGPHPPPVFEERGKGRHYPGEAEGGFLIACIEYLGLSASKRKSLLRQLHILWNYEEAIHNGRSTSEMERSVIAIWKQLERTILSGHPIVADVCKEGLIVQPTGPDGRAALALLSLSVRHERLTRMRTCLHCGSWFFARFASQKFCNDAQKSCQWDHYHTPGWRKLNRERNRKHQREYRRRLFGKRES